MKIISKILHISAAFIQILNAAPIVTVTTPTPNTSVGVFTSVSVTFSEAVSGVNAYDLEINGAPAIGVSGSAAGPYVFTFTEPANGTVSVNWSEEHGIAGIGTGEYISTGAWSYTLTDSVAPKIASIRSSVAGQEILHIYPTPSSQVTTLTQVSVMFDEEVIGVDASDLLVNGIVATSLAGSAAGPYIFTFPSPANGAVSFTWAATTGIVDGEGNGYINQDWQVTKVASLGTVIITEFLAANAGVVSNTTNGTRDENFDLSPWIELYNSGSSTVDLTGWSLTNDASDPDLWILPSRILLSGERLVIWASEKDRKPSSGNLHTNFSLDVNGGYLALHRPEYPRSAAVSKFPNNYPTVTSYPSQRYDYSYGLQSTDNALRYFSPPSVAQANYTLPSSTNPTPTPPDVPTGLVNGSSVLNTITPTPSSSVSRGFFKNPFSVVLSCADANATIRYTLNGSQPLSTDAIYTSPIAVTGTTVLRFTAFAANALPSATVTHTYLFADTIFSQTSPSYNANNNVPSVGGEPLPISWGKNAGWGFPGLIDLGADEVPADYGMDQKISSDPSLYADDGTVSASGKTNLNRMKEALRELPALCIVMKNFDMFGDGTTLSTNTGLYPKSTSANKNDNTKPCSMEMFQADGNTIFSSDCGIDLHGNASRDPYKNPKHGFTIRFKGRYGNGRLKAKIFPDSPVEEWDKFVLRGDYGFSWLHPDPASQRPRGIRIRDAFCRHSFRDMGGIAGHTRCVNLFINGIYWGTYDIAEDEAQDFAASYFGGDKSSYDVIEQNALKNGTWTAYREVKRILGWTGSTYSTVPTSTVLNSTFTNAQYEEIKQYLDTLWHADYMILHYLIGHEDWATEANYNKNWYAVKAPNGTFKYLPWDMENVMNSRTLNRVTGAAYPPTAIQSRLKKNSQYLLDFADRVNRHMVNPDGALTTSKNIARFDHWAGIMNAGAICLESARWGDYRDRVHVYSSDSNIIYTWNGKWYENGTVSSTTTNWLTEMNRMKSSYFPDRTMNVMGQFRSASLYPQLNAPEFFNHSTNDEVGSQQVASGFLLRLQLPASPPSGTTNTGTIYYTLDGSDPRVYYDTTGQTTASALVYSNPITLNTSTTVKARTLNGTTWSALRESTYTIGDARPNVVISEIHYRPNSGGTSREFIEICNAGNTAVDISLWHFSGIDFVIPFGTMIAPSARLVMVNNNNPAAFTAVYPTVSVLGYFSGSLDNNSERISLLDRNDSVISTVEYDDETPWTSSPDGTGPSLERIDLLGDGDFAGNWQASSVTHGTPGQPNSTSSVTLQLSEFGTNVVNDFIEIRNASSASQSTLGWSLRVLLENGTYQYVPITATTLSANQLLSISSLNLSAQHGEIYLLDNTGKTQDAIRYGPQAKDFTFSRISGVWSLSEPTPNGTNLMASTGIFSQLVLNEFHPNPIAGQDDWLEIANKSSAPINLTNLQIRVGTELQNIISLTSIAPMGYAKIYANSDHQRGDTLPTSLSAEGASITLQQTNGMVIDEQTYTNTVSGVSMGRLPDATGLLSTLVYPSPSAANHAVLTNVPKLNEVLVKNHHGIINPWAKRSAWLEIKNPLASNILLDGWSLRTIGDQISVWNFPDGITLTAASHFLIWADTESPISTVAGKHYNCGLSIDSEFQHDYSAWGLELVNPSGQVADRITWGLQIPDRSIGTDGTVWSLQSAATPAAPNTGEATISTTTDLKINEWTSTTINIGSNSFPEFVEIYNPSSNIVNLTNLWLGDEPSESGLKKWQFPPLSFMGENSYSLLLTGANSSDPAKINFKLSSGGEMILLSNDAGSIIDQVNFGLGSSTQSAGRAPDGGATISNMFPTPNASNTILSGSLPIIYQHPFSQSVSAGGSLVLSTLAYQANSYQWFRNGATIAGATSNSLTLSPLTSFHDAYYYCVVTNTLGSVNSSTATIQVLYHYALLASEKSLSSIQGDDDGDGISNGIEFFNGTDPNVVNASSNNFLLTESGGDKYFDFTVKKSSRIGYCDAYAELSPNLQSWTEQAPHAQTLLETLPNGDQMIQYRYSIPANQQRYFMRMIVEP